jgi:hypothetical protein
VRKTTIGRWTPGPSSEVVEWIYSRGAQDAASETDSSMPFPEAGACVPNRNLAFRVARTDANLYPSERAIAPATVRAWTSWR